MSAATTKPLRAEAYYDTDGELWAIFVEGHVSRQRFDAAFRGLMRRCQVAKDCFEDTRMSVHDMTIEHVYMRPTGTNEDGCEMFDWCQASAKTGRPVTAFKFQ